MRRKVSSGRITACSIYGIVALLMIAAFICTPDHGFRAGAAKAEKGGLLEIILIDVGQGDSTLVKSPDGRFLLIDSGESKNIGAVINALKGAGAEKLDYVVSTHPHSDHIGGFPKILGQFTVNEVFDIGKPHTTSTYRNYLEAVRSSGAKFHLARAGVSFMLGSSVKVSFLWPDDDMPNDINDSSCVLLIEYLQFDALFAGDIGSNLEGMLIDEEMIPDVELLKAAHHGSKYSSSASFLESASPELVVIQVGNGNDYGYPHPQAIGRIEAVSAEVFRTDRDGSITVTSDGNNWWVRSDRGRIAGGKAEGGLTQLEHVSDLIYVGSVNSAVFHLQECDSVKDILKANLVVYSNREEAVGKGKRPCKVCNP